jgi:hypothetical protein
MIRTQISLDEEDYVLVKQEADVLGVSVAEFVRRAIRRRLPPKDGPPWMRYAGFVASGDPNSSSTVDDVVYGQKD